MVEDGAPLWKCLGYVDLNMVRAGVVSHPACWTWCGYRELVGEKTRYCPMDRDRLLELSGKSDIESFVEEYRARIEHAIVARRLERERRWTESIAVGSHARLFHRSRLDLRVTIPIHNKDLPSGTPKSILRQAGLSAEEFLEFLD